MKKRGKRYLEALKKVEKGKLYEPLEALELIKEMACAKFDETVEAAFNLGVDTKKSDQQVRGAVVLPNGTGRTRKVLVFAKGDKIKEAKEAGADIIGDEEILSKIEQGWLDFDVIVSTPDMMPLVGKLGRILGPKGLMPNPKTGTVTLDVAKAIKDIKAGKIEYKVDKTGVVHAAIGKVSFSAQSLLENLKALTESLIKAKPSSSKGVYIKKVSVSSTMGPGVAINSMSLIDKR